MNSREQFEQWISAPPYEYTVLRYPEDETEFAWPGQYRNVIVQVAWEAWQEADKETERLRDIINRASVQFFRDGTDGETAAKMLTVLNEAIKTPNAQAHL